MLIRQKLKSSMSNYMYFHEGGYAIIVVCLSVSNFAQKHVDLHESFRQGWQWAKEQMIIFLVAIQIMDPDCDTGKTCLGRGMLCFSASSLALFSLFISPQYTTATLGP